MAYYFNRKRGLLGYSTTPADATKIARIGGKSSMNPLSSELSQMPNTAWEESSYPPLLAPFLNTTGDLTDANQTIITAALATGDVIQIAELTASSRLLLKTAYMEIVNNSGASITFNFTLGVILNGVQQGYILPFKYYNLETANESVSNASTDDTNLFISAGVVSALANGSAQVINFDGQKTGGDSKFPTMYTLPTNINSTLALSVTGGSLPQGVQINFVIPYYQKTNPV